MKVNGSQSKALEFLRVAHLYRLGHLPTERPHPATRDLADRARNDPATAVALLKEVDLRALRVLRRYAGDIDRMARAVQSTLARGGRIFLCGCGATGRLSLSLETLWRELGKPPESVVAFMAGGDVALVHSLEGFEDHPDFGARHLEQLGFADGDLLIASTEGGETPYVIGATLRAAEISSNAPFFLYCNADEALLPTIDRFRKIHEHASIRRICLHVGPMALAGSTRMQASTVLQLAVGVALLHPERPAGHWIRAYRAQLRETDLSWLAAFVGREAGIYRDGGYVHYQVRDFGITVFTDTTERAPTFSLAPFEPTVGGGSCPPSLCYLSLRDAATREQAWERLLGRQPRSLDWSDVDPRTEARYLEEFDFSRVALQHRRRRCPSSPHHEFRIEQTVGGILFDLHPLAHELRSGDLPPLFRHLLLKQVLNIHSTLVMGRLGRYEGNLMTWVSPTNGKLVDRAVRYASYLVAREAGRVPAYALVVRRLFEELDHAAPGESVVLRTVTAMLNGRASARAGRVSPPPRARERTSSERARESLG